MKPTEKPLFVHKMPTPAPCELKCAHAVVLHGPVTAHACPTKVHYPATKRPLLPFTKLGLIELKSIIRFNSRHVCHG